MRRWQVRPDDNGTRVPSLVILPLVARILFAFALMAPILSWSLSLSLSLSLPVSVRVIDMYASRVCWPATLSPSCSVSPCCYSPPCPGLVPDKEDKRARNREYTDGIFSLSLTHSRELPKHVSKHTDLFLVLSLVCSCCCCCVQPFTWAILRSLLRHELPTENE